MREKHLSKFATMLIAVLMCLAMIMSCSKDDDDKSVKSGENNDNKVELMGSWTLISCDENGSPIGATYTFSDNGTGTIAGGGKSTTFTYTYKANGEFTITLSDSNHFMKGLIAVSGNTASGTYRWNDGSTDHHFSFKKSDGSTPDDDSGNDDKGEEKPAFKLNDGDPIPASIKANPAAYGFEVIQVNVDKYSYDESSTIRYTELFAEQDSEGFFILGDVDGIGNIYHTWSTIKSYDLPFEYTFDGLYNLNTGDKYYSKYDGDAQQRLLILPATHELQKVHWLDTEVKTVNSDASPYLSSYGYNTSGSVFFDVYDNVDVSSQVQVSYSDSWLTGRIRVAYRKGEDNNNATRIAIDYAKTQNTGNDRTGYIYITVTGIDGKSYTQTYTIIQSGASSSGGNSGGGTTPSSGTSSNLVTGKVAATVKAIGPGVSYDSYASYVNGKTTRVDYEYNPSAGKYYVYGGTYDSNSSANGGKGVRYNAQKGYNSITIDNGYYYDYSMRISYRWEIVLQVTLP